MDEITIEDYEIKSSVLEEQNNKDETLKDKQENEINKLIGDESASKNSSFDDIKFNRKTAVYVKVNSEGFITDINSEIFIKNYEGWQKFDEGEGDKFVHAQTQYFDQPIINDEGKYNYKLN